MIYVRFERGRDDVIGPTYGPYDYVQFVYGTLTVPSTYGDVIDLATKEANGDWLLADLELTDYRFSDIIVYSD